MKLREPPRAVVASAPAAPGLPSIVVPELSPGLRWQVEWFGEGRPAAAISAIELAEAGRVLGQLDALCAPAAVGTIEAWLTLVALGIGNPPGEDVFASRVAMVCDTSGDLPLACWTRETRRDFARRGRDAAFFPGDGEVDAFLRPIGAELRARRDRLRRLREHHAAPRPVPRVVDPAARPVRDLVGEERDAAIAHVAATRRSWERDRHAIKPVEHHPSPEPARLRPVHVRGERLWLLRNRSREARGLPPLPRPPTFEGYGER